MRFDLYQKETAQLATEYNALLEIARQKLLAGEALSQLEQNGVLHAFQVLIENAIGKAKQILKFKDENVPVSAYDAFSSLVRINIMSDAELPLWNSVIGLRNRIVHEYMNIDIDRVLNLVSQNEYKFIVDFLLNPMPNIQKQ